MPNFSVMHTCFWKIIKISTDASFFLFVFPYPDIRSNLMGTKFTVYDHGVSPIKAQGQVEKAHTRQELAAIYYVSSASSLLPPSSL